MTNSVELAWSCHGDLAVIRTRGYLNRRVGRQIALLARRLLERGRRRLLLNLEEAPLVNHDGVAELFELTESLGKLDGRLSICGVTPTVEKVFHITGLDREMEIFPEEASALAALRRDTDF
jgi:anti-anti-sigma factor